MICHQLIACGAGDRKWRQSIKKKNDNNWEIETNWRVWLAPRLAHPVHYITTPPKWNQWHSVFINIFLALYNCLWHATAVGAWQQDTILPQMTRNRRSHSSSFWKCFKWDAFHTLCQHRNIFSSCLRWRCTARQWSAPWRLVSLTLSWPQRLGTKQTSPRKSPSKWSFPRPPSSATSACQFASTLILTMSPFPFHYHHLCAFIPASFQGCKVTECMSQIQFWTTFLFKLGDRQRQLCGNFS